MTGALHQDLQKLQAAHSRIGKSVDTYFQDVIRRLLLGSATRGACRSDAEVTQEKLERLSPHIAMASGYLFSDIRHLLAMQKASESSFLPCDSSFLEARVGREFQVTRAQRCVMDIHQMLEGVGFMPTIASQMTAEIMKICGREMKKAGFQVIPEAIINSTLALPPSRGRGPSRGGVDIPGGAF